MPEQTGLINITEWGLNVVLKDNVIIDDKNIFPTITLILDKCKEYKKNKVFIDALTVNRHVSVLKLLEVAELISKECSRLKIAFVAPHLVDNSDSKAMETFSFNRGVYIQYFRDKDTAMEWLLE
jgi:hypothetical protein